MSQTFHCYEFLLLRKIEDDEELWNELKQKVLGEDKNDGCVQISGNHSTEIRLTRNSEQSYDGITTWQVHVHGVPPELWYLAITLEKTRDRFIKFVESQANLELSGNVKSPGERLLSSYLNSHFFVVLHLDSVFKYGESAVLPRELFKCMNVKSLSLRYNYLEEIPADIGRLQKLEYLALTNNRLQNKSIPYTLTFCQKLRVLLLDNNLLDALPGFLLQMPMLRTVHRHGNHNYFKTTFMWYHTDVNDRILHVQGLASSDNHSVIEVNSLLFLAAKTVIASKINFYSSSVIAEIIKDYISDIHHKFSICGNCDSACRQSEPGYKVYTFKNPYLGNTCVPFQHWACSVECAEAIEIPARVEQIMSALEQDRQYDNYVKEAQVKCSRCRNRESYNLGFACEIL